MAPARWGSGSGWVQMLTAPSSVPAGLQRVPDGGEDPGGGEFTSSSSAAPLLVQSWNVRFLS